MVADERHRQLRQIDISRYGRSLFWLQRANFFVLVFSLSLALAAINVVAQSLLGGSYPSLIAVVQCVISMGVAFVAWKTVGKIEPRVWPFYLFLFFFGALFYWSFLIALLFSAPTHNFPLFREAQGAILVALSFTLGMPAALTLSRAKIGPDKLPISRITSWLKERIDSAEIDVAKVDKINRPVGWAYRIAGILTLFLGYEHLHRHPDAYSVAVIMVFFGTALLIRSRRYFQIKAESLLRSDSRRPILFLRSFSDDDRERLVVSDQRLVDFSFETRLADHFFPYGPFIAVGSPDDDTLQIGAARARLSNQEWQETVKSWMETSLVIVAIAGKTPWLAWELTQIVQKQLALKLILLFPPRPTTPIVQQAWKWWKKLHDYDVRMVCVREALASSQWAFFVSAIDDARTLCAIVLHADGTMTIIRSKYKNRDAHHLAAVIAHYYLWKLNGTAQSFQPIPPLTR